MCRARGRKRARVAAVASDRREADGAAELDPTHAEGALRAFAEASGIPFQEVTVMRVPNATFREAGGRIPCTKTHGKLPASTACLTYFFGVRFLPQFFCVRVEVVLV